MLFGLVPISKPFSPVVAGERVRAKSRVQAANTRARLYIVLMVLVLGGTALIVRAIDLQIVRKNFYQEQGDARFLRDMPVPSASTPTRCANACTSASTRNSSI